MPDPKPTAGAPSAPKTLRLHFPQWQGGNLAEYHVGSGMLSWLLPPFSGPEEVVPVPRPEETASPKTVNGILAKQALLNQARAAREAIERHCPDRVVTIGGDCLVDLAPVAYLNRRHNGKLERFQAQRARCAVG